MIHDDIELTLRSALDEQARRIDVSPDALTTIRSRTRKRARVHRGGFMVSLTTGTGVLAATAVFAFASVTGGCGPQQAATHTPAASAPVATSPATAPSVTTTTSAPPSTNAQADPVNVPIYYVGLNAKLYREYHRVPVASDATAAYLDAAIAQMLGPAALDPDYHSGWPAGASVLGVTVSGGVATVDLHNATTNSGSAASNQAAIQELIWTATAYTGGIGVRLLFDGVPRTTLWATAQPVSGVLHRAAAVNTLAPVWIIDPQQGVTSGSPVTVHIAGIVFEGRVLVVITNQQSGVQKPLAIQLSVGAPAQGTATLSVTLAPGRYRIAASVAGLKTVNTQVSDDHTFTVT